MQSPTIPPHTNLPTPTNAATTGAVPSTATGTSTIHRHSVAALRAALVVTNAVELGGVKLAIKGMELTKEITSSLTPARGGLAGVSIGMIGAAVFFKSIGVNPLDVWPTIVTGGGPVGGLAGATAGTAREALSFDTTKLRETKTRIEERLRDLRGQEERMDEEMSIQTPSSVVMSGANQQSDPLVARFEQLGSSNRQPEQHPAVRPSQTSAKEDDEYKNLQQQLENLPAPPQAIIPSQEELESRLSELEAEVARLRDNSTPQNRQLDTIVEKPEPA